MAQKKDLDYFLAQAKRIAEHREEDAERIIRKIYKHMYKDLQAFVSETYVKYAEDDKLTYAMLQRAGYNARFLEEIEKHVNVATPKAAKELRELVEETYRIAYEGMVEGVAKSGAGGLDKAFAESEAITPEQIKAAVQNPVSGLTLKDTLEKNRREIIYGIKQTVGVGLMNGDRYTTMAERIAKQVDSDYNKAIRIARTEAHRVFEAGNDEAGIRLDKALQNGTSGLRMTKEWRTMQDERVRPQRRRKGKRGWSTKMGRGANHMKMQGQIVLADEMFDLLDGNKAISPGNSGVAGHDINCRCRASRKLMDDEEYFKATGKHFPGWNGKQDDTADDTAPSRKEMREKIKEDRRRINDMKSDLRDVDLDIAEHDRKDFDDLKGLKKSDITGRIKEIEEREEYINPIADRLYHRPERGTPEYEEWREWKNGIDRNAIIDEQMELAKEKAALNSKLRKYERYEKWEQWKVDHPLADLQTKRVSIIRKIKDLESEIKEIEKELAANPVMQLVDMLDDRGITFNAVKKHIKALDDSEIISALAGGDTTKGSCASVGLAYMGQRGGLDVLDFRGGDSCDFFATTANLRKIAELPGVKTIHATARSSTTAGNRLLKQVETGKEYYLVTGRHAAIVRKTEEGTLQYLELQSSWCSGWTDFDGNPRYTLKNRFGEVSGFDVDSFMIEVDSFKDSDDLKQLLGYINTAEDAQRKGKHGTIK